MATRIKNRRDTAALWTLNNPVLALAEQGYETDSKKWKTGDGVTAWNDLAYETVSYATEILAGIVTRATNAEVLEGTDTLKYTSSASVKNAIDSAIAELIENAPESLNTLEELAEALGDDPNFATTISTMIGQRIRYDEIVNSLTSSATTFPLSANQGKVLKDLIDGILTTLTTHASDISARILTSDIVDTLVSTETTKPLSANAGKTLKGLVDSLAFDTVTTISGDTTLTLTHSKNILKYSGAAAKIMVPTNASAAFTAGDRIGMMNLSTGEFYVEPAVGVAVNSLKSNTAVLYSGGFAWLRYLGSDAWAFEGDLKPRVEPEAQSLINAIGTLSASEQTYLNTFYKRLKGYNTYGVNFYHKFDFFNVYMGGTSTAHKWNGVTPIDSNGAFREEYTGSPTQNSNGVTTNGSNQYANNHYSPSQRGLANKHHSIYLRSVGVGTQFGGMSNVFKGDWLAIDLSGTLYWSLSKTYTTTTTPVTKTGFYLLNRPSAMFAELKRNNVQIHTDTTGSDFVDASEILAGARNASPTIAVYSADNWCFRSAGASLTNQESEVLYNAVVELQTSLGRNV
jgi:hypothetical protein